jgi:hypothetical protein
MTIDLENAEVALRAERRKTGGLAKEVRQLKNAREIEAREGANIELIERLWEFHRQHVRPRNRKMDIKTIEAVRARLSDTLPNSDEPAYSPRYIAEAILGAKYEAFTNAAGKRFDQLELICRDPAHLESFHERFERHRERQNGRAA